MHEDYYLNILYPIQDRVLDILSSVENNFYLTGETALSRAYLHHRYSDDLDFFVNDDEAYTTQVERIYRSMQSYGLTIEKSVFHESFSRLFVHENTDKNKTTLKIDFVNDIEYRVGKPEKTSLFIRTDSVRNILSNKISALGRLETKDVADIIFIALNYSFNWKEIFSEASQKDLWVNPVDTAALLENFPTEKIDEIAWTTQKIKPSKQDVQAWIKQMIRDIIKGDDNKLFE